MSELSKLGRDKHWGELSADERIERMRREVKRYQNMVHELMGKMNEMEYHIHEGGNIYYRKDRPEIGLPFIDRRNTGDTYF